MNRHLLRDLIARGLYDEAAASEEVEMLEDSKSYLKRFLFEEIYGVFCKEICNDFMVKVKDVKAC